MKPASRATTANNPAELRPTLPEWALISRERQDDVERVAALASHWAEQLGVPDSERNRCSRAIWLHDDLRDAPAAVLEQWASSSSGPPELRLGSAIDARARAEGEYDRGVLDAVPY